MKSGTHRIYIWCGPLGLTLFFAGFLIAHLLPLPSPTENASQISTFYRSHTDLIRVGLVFAIFGATLLGPWVAMLSVMVKRIEGRLSPAAYCQLALGSLLILEFIIPLMILETAVFRPNRSPSEILLLSDVCWTLFVGVVSTAVVEVFFIGLTIRRDKSQNPIFPNWMSNFSFLVAAIFMSGTFVVFFKTGPLAWNGVLAWWVAVSAFGIWLLAITIYMLRAPNSDVREELDESTATFGGEQIDMRPQLELLSADVAPLRKELHCLSPHRDS